jgi:hypothetical protein
MGTGKAAASGSLLETASRRRAAGTLLSFEEVHLKFTPLPDEL